MAPRSIPPGTIRIPAWLEGVGAGLPRRLLDYLEIRGWPKIISSGESLATARFWRSRKIALVKQSSYHALYEPASKSTAWREIVLANAGHLGPFSFLADLGADYHVVHQEPDPECFLWKLKYANCPDPQKEFTQRLKEMEDWKTSPAAKAAVFCRDVPWDDYDLVVCLDIPIPDRIVQRCRKPCWAYLSTEPGSDLQKWALQKPREGYRLFLNHGFRRHRSRPRNQDHVVEFPFSFQSTRAWSELLGDSHCRRIERNGILLERGSWREPMPSFPLPFTKLAAHPRDYPGVMASHRYAVRTDARRRWGNWSIEAVLAGNLFLASASALDHRSILLPGLDCPNLETACRIIESVEKAGAYAELLHWQREIAEHLAFRRPLRELGERSGVTLRGSH